jgi:hypothetical protein
VWFILNTVIVSEKTTIETDEGDIWDCKELIWEKAFSCRLDRNNLESSVYQSNAKILINFNLILFLQTLSFVTWVCEYWERMFFQRCEIWLRANRRHLIMMESGNLPPLLTVRLYCQDSYVDFLLTIEYWVQRFWNANKEIESGNVSNVETYWPQRKIYVGLIPTLKKLRSSPMSNWVRRFWN